VPPLLWFARMRYRPGGPPEDPTLRDAWALGRSREDGPESCPTPEHMRRVQSFSSQERGAYWSGAQTRMADPAAPIPLPAEAVLLAIEAAIAAITGTNIPALLCAIPVSLSVGQLRTELEQRQAQRLGLTREAAPQQRVAVEQAWVGFARLAYLRGRGLNAAQPSWEVTFAQSLIREIDRRRAWRRALRRSLPV
jgi:hypothetical protein